MQLADSPQLALGTVTGDVRPSPPTTGGYSHAFKGAVAMAKMETQKSTPEGSG